MSRNMINRYTAGGDWGLENGIFGSKRFGDGNWQGFQGKDMEAVVDLGKMIEVSSVSITSLQKVSSWIVLPEHISIFTSEDGVSYKETAIIKHDIPATNLAALIQQFKTQFDPTKARYVKVIAKNYGTLPDWHESAGEDSWLFVDEIIIE